MILQTLKCHYCNKPIFIKITFGGARYKEHTCNCHVKYGKTTALRVINKDKSSK